MMKKNFKFYAIGWALLLIIFNVISILVPGWPTLEKTTPSFWIGYAFINAAFVGQLVCAWMAFKDDSAKKTFYNLSLFSVSYAGLVSNFVVGAICMIITPLPYWVGAIICPFIFIVNLIAVIKAKIAVELVSEVDAKVETATAFIYEMREESESLFVRAKADEAKAVICKKVRDAFKFSDPMSKSDLDAVEAEIKTHFDLLKKAIVEGKMDVATAESDELLALISERNNKCKKLK